MEHIHRVSLCYYQFSQDSYFILRKKGVRSSSVLNFQHQHSPSLGRKFKRGNGRSMLNTKEHSIVNPLYIHMVVATTKPAGAENIQFYHSQQINFPFIKTVLKGQITLARQPSIASDHIILEFFLATKLSKRQ